MNAHEAYFQRNRGEWDWYVRFDVLSWSGLWKANLSLLNKLRLASFVLCQPYIGGFRMWTKVDLGEGSEKVRHSTKVKALGITFLRSEKVFHLGDDGHSLRLEGAEFYWPMSGAAVPFENMVGAVDASTTHACYQMPLLGLACDCNVILEPELAEIKITAPWIKGRFWLQEDSLEKLRERFRLP
ncbi:MAG: hypothetical protein ACXWQO_11510 [Bdellovibrionota bacterium]